MKHKEHILIGFLYLLSPFIGQLLVERLASVKLNGMLSR
ncbi:Uncharacterised protein [Streptococcus pneumoniae]|nr:Uncharacterised protein [Streptococcus pneumoniae]